MLKAIINTTLYDFNHYMENAFVVFDSEIREVGIMHDFIDCGYEIIDGEKQLLMPGLVCGHTHLYSAFARGMSVPFHPDNFQDILDQLWWKLDRHLDMNMVHDSGLVFALDFLKNGITTLIDHHASGKDILGTLTALKRAVTQEVGLRGVFAFETSDRFDIAQCIEENTAFIKENHSAFSRGLFGLHASSSLSDETLAKVKKVLEENPIHVHVAESTLDEEISCKKYQKPIIHRLVDHGLLTPNSLLAHAIHVNHEELDLIQKHKAVIVVNFSSNMNNSVGLPSLKRFREHGIKVIIGNDGISSSMTTEYLMAYYASHHLDQTPNLFGLEDLKKIINDTYQYVSDLLQIKLGKIEPSYQADLLLVPYQPPTPMDKNNAFGHLFFGLFNSFKPQHVFINGVQKINQYQSDQKLEDAYQKATSSAIKLWEKIQKEVKP